MCTVVAHLCHLALVQNCDILNRFFLQICRSIGTCSWVDISNPFLIFHLLYHLWTKYPRLIQKFLHMKQILFHFIRLGIPLGLSLTFLLIQFTCLMKMEILSCGQQWNTITRFVFFSLLLCVCAYLLCYGKEFLDKMQHHFLYNGALSSFGLSINP